MDFQFPNKKPLTFEIQMSLSLPVPEVVKQLVLVERLCRLVLKDHISIDSILAMTFTKDAAK